MNRRRLDFEAMRDSCLAVSGRLDTAFGGRPVDIEKTPFSNRRSVYAFIDRNNFPGLFRTFDLPTPDTSSPQRPETIVPQQALYGLNSPFIQEISAATASRVLSTGPKTSREQIVRLYRTVLSRSPTASETSLAETYLAAHPTALAQLAQTLILTNEFWFVD